MKIILVVFVVLLGLVVFGLAYVRLAPTDPARWHQPITADTSVDLMGGAVRVIAANAEALARVDAAAQALPRTRRIAGSVDEGRVTYVTRSRWIGFPDYTTLEYADGQLKLFARLRFGGSDFGVNAERLERLLSVVEG